MTLRWFLFSHAMKQLGEAPTPRPFFAVHLVDTDAEVTAPICGDDSATIITNADEPRGFALACCSCLPRSEVRNG